MKIRPLNQYVLIEVKNVETTKTGIFLAKDTVKLEEAKVVACSDDVTTVAIGETILFKDYSMDKVEIDGKEYCFLKEDMILGIKK